MENNPWLIRRRGPSGPTRLYCFPYAGGGAHTIFQPWQAALGSSIEVCGVQFPGRGMRLGEAPIKAMALLIEQLAGQISTQPDVPFSFFGHSLGGLVAFELAHCLRERGLRLPDKLIVSACHAPRHRTPFGTPHELADGPFIELLRNYNGTPEEVLANKELMELLLPTLRADFSIVANYRHVKRPRLPVPMTVLAGTRDRHASPIQVTGWAEETSAACTVHWLDAGHFFIHSMQDTLLDYLRAELATAVPQR